MKNSNNNAGVTIIAECRACGGPMRSPEVHNALSRFCKAYICNDCGTREAFEGFFWRSNAIAAGLLDAEIATIAPSGERIEPHIYRKGLRVSVYKERGRDYSNSGFSSYCDELTLVGDGIPEIFEATDEAPEVQLVIRPLNTKAPKGFPICAAGGYIHAEPVFPPPQGEIGWMAGGCFIHSSDSRFPFSYPISLHDRAESQRLNDRMSV